MFRTLTSDSLGGEGKNKSSDIPIILNKWKLLVATLSVYKTNVVCYSIRFLNKLSHHQRLLLWLSPRRLCMKSPHTCPISHRHESQLPKHVGYAQWIYLWSRDFWPVHRYFNYWNMKLLAQINNLDIETPPAESAQPNQFPQQHHHILVYKTWMCNKGQYNFVNRTIHWSTT